MPMRHDRRNRCGHREIDSSWRSLPKGRLIPAPICKNEERVPGAGTHQATPEVDIVQPDPAFSAQPEVFAGDDPRADAEGRSILDHMRTVVDAETTDGENGVAWAYERRYVSLQDIRASYRRYLDLKDLVHRFMTRPGE